ncbi:hypothetical protein [Paenibacillus sp. YN15]|uniref:hypothetical protein n=1 Tax=Paenibacillus sp. YN15 TaxID=1742774 RepID=UPI0011BE0764|nr:hypothetical protein [Paenibacillus sp. YN15]
MAIRRAIAGGLVLLLLAVGASGLYAHGRNTDEVVLYVNDEPVTRQEFTLYMQDTIAQVAAEFHQKYEAEASGDFWTTAYNGRTPLAELKERTISKIVSAKVEQIQARSYGIIEDIGYRAFQKALKDENERRAKAVRQGEAVYGPVRFGEREYASYLQGAMEEKLQQVLWEEKLRAPEEQLQSYYEKIKDTFYHLGYELETEEVFCESPGDLQGAMEVLEQAMARAAGGESLRVIVEDENRRLQNPLVYRSQLLGSRSASKEDSRSAKLEETALQYKAGELSPIFQLEQEIGFIRVGGINNLGYQPFSSVKDGVIQHYVQERLQNLLKQLEQEANVRIEAKALDETLGALAK